MKNDRTNRWTSLASSLALASALALPAIAMPTAAHAQEGAQRFDIAAGDLARALQDYSAATGVQLVYSSELVADKRSPGVSGRLSRGDALARLLGGTGLMAKMSGNSATITPIADAVAPGEGERVLGAVRVEGSQSASLPRATSINGINGSRDVTATEGTGSYTSNALTIGSKYPAPMKDIPQSISILTSERIKDQNVRSLDDAMRQVPGVTVVQNGNSLQTRYFSRGFPLESVSIDGGTPISTGLTKYGNGANSIVPTFDMSVYDHVEVLRGAAGLFNGYGDPSGTINLVRKKPLDHEQFLTEMQFGSWNNYRVSMDGTTPLALDGRLRGRLVVTWQSQKHFYEVAQDKKHIVYGILDFDATPSTLITAGMTYTESDSAGGWFSGLPRFRNGEPLGLPRSRCLCVPWAHFDIETTEPFFQVQQQLGPNWQAKFNYSYTGQSSDDKHAEVQTTGIDPATLGGAALQASEHKNKNRAHSFELTLSGKFYAFGNEQNILFGANMGVRDGGGNKFIGASYQPSSARPAVDVFSFDPNDARFSPAPILGVEDVISKDLVRSFGAYINFDAQPLKNVHIISGFRINKITYKREGYSVCNGIYLKYDLCNGASPGEAIPQTPEEEEHLNRGYGSSTKFSWPPSISLRFDLSKHTSLYLGYTDIYQDQSNLLSGDCEAGLPCQNLTPLGPVTGGNYEAGVKWSGDEDRINASLSLYYIDKSGIGIFDESQSYASINPSQACCYIYDRGDKQISYGVDVDVSGRIFDNLQASVSYTYNKNEFKGAENADFPGKSVPLVSYAPRHIYRLWMSYNVPKFDRDLTLFGGVSGQSSSFQRGKVCTVGLTPNGFGGYNCNVPEIPYQFTEKGWFIVSAGVRYRLNSTFDVAVNFDNIFDKTYYQTVGGVLGGNWYGAPRSAMVSLHGKW